MIGAEGMGQFMAHSTTHPKYLHSNSTSHVWAFGAIAELVDNALDASARKFHIDLMPTSQLFAVKPEPGSRRPSSSSKHKSEPFVMTFKDDGKGMTPLELHKMLSFGHCDKDQFVSENGQVMPIGHYGNGFKSGSMRLGKDALVFTKSQKTQSVGLLSQTFLKDTKAMEVFVPIVSWDNETGEAISVSYSQQKLSITPIHTSPALTEAFKANVKVINKYSPYGSTAALRVALDKIQGTGTHVVVYNLRKPEQTDETCEFSLVDNSEVGIEHDIQLAKCMWDEVTVAAGHSLAPLYYSLREYTSILYLNPRMQIWIRGHKVQLRKLEYCLYKPRECTYRSKASDADPVTVTLGFNLFSEKEHFGMMIYHRDRLIKCFLHVGYQLSPDSRGVGVIGVLNVNALQPTHNKQSFIMDNNYRLLVNNLKDQLAKYWAVIPGKGLLTQFWCQLARARSNSKSCVQCTKCMKWRITKLPYREVPELWECKLLEAGYDCSIPEHLPRIEKLAKRGPSTNPGDIEKKLEEQVVKIEKRHKETLTKLRAVKAKELATATGFSLEKCTAALKVSADNKEIAGELLFSNKPIPGFDFEVDEDGDQEEEDGEEEEEEEEQSDDDDGEESALRPKKRRRIQPSKRKSKSSSSSSSSSVLAQRRGSASAGGPTDREKRLVERQKLKQRMLEERMQGRDSSTLESRVRSKGKEKDASSDGATTTNGKRRRGRPPKRRDEGGVNEEGFEEEVMDDSEDEEQEDQLDDDDNNANDSAVRRPFGAVAYCERCEIAEAEITLMRRRIKELEDLLQRAGTPVPPPQGQADGAPPASSEGDEDEEDEEEDEGVGGGEEPTTAPVAVKVEPDYDFIEFI